MSNTDQAHGMSRKLVACKAILAHVSDEVLKSERFEIHSLPGYVILPDKLEIERELVPGLHAD